MPPSPPAAPASPTRSLQADDDTPTTAVVKHWIAHEQRTGEEQGPRNMDVRTLRQIYNPPSALSTKERPPHSLMCAFTTPTTIQTCQTPLPPNVL